MREAVVRAARALLSPEQLAEVVAHRANIERAKGVLMIAYGVDADDAFEMLKTESQASNVKLRVIAERLIEDLTGADHSQSGRLRAACDERLPHARDRKISSKVPS